MSSERPTKSRPGALPEPDEADGHHRQTLTVTEAASLLGISRSLAYQLVADNTLPAKRLRGRIVIPRRNLERWVEQP